jgi:very-short-patch-repair endonuclease
MRLEQDVLDLSAKQHGAIATWQLRALGLGRDETHRLRRSTTWAPASTRVLVRTGAPATDDQRLMVAMLDASPGAAIAGTTAAAMWGAPGFSLAPIHLVRPKGVSRRPSRLAVVHEVVDLRPAHLKVIRGITVVSPARVVCELTGTHPHRAERVLDRFWSERLLDGRTFERTVAELAERGRTGSTLMRELDASRGSGYVPPASGLERRFLQICEWRMERQVDSGGEEWCGRVDFRDSTLPLVVEVQSERYHASLVDRAADATRRERLERAGFVVVEAWDTEVWHQPATVNERIRLARWPLVARSA